MADELPRIGEPSRYPDGGLNIIPDFPISSTFVQNEFAPTLIPYQSKIDDYRTMTAGGKIMSPEKQRQIQEPIEFLRAYSSNTTIPPYQIVEQEFSRPYAYSQQMPSLNPSMTKPSYSPMDAKIGEDYPLELRPTTEYYTKSDIDPRLSDMKISFGSAYNSTGDVGVGGLAFGTHAGTGLGFTTTTQKNIPSITTNPSTNSRVAYKNGGPSSYDQDLLHNNNNSDGSVTRYYGKMLPTTTPRQNMTTIPGSTNDGSPSETPSPSSLYLDLTGQHHLCPTATMANLYSYCDNPNGTCDNDSVNIVPITGLVNHYYCTDPYLPYNKLNTCPEGYTLVDNNSACLSNTL